MQLGLQNLTQHKLRSLLTMLGMIFGVAAVVSMLSIGAGAQQQVIAFIEQMGFCVTSWWKQKEARNTTEVQKTRKISPGLSLPGLPRHSCKCRRPYRNYRAQTLHSHEIESQARSRNAGGLRG